MVRISVKLCLLVRLDVIDFCEYFPLSMIQEQGCDPFCARGGGMCTKYVVTDRNSDRTIRWEAHFCGLGIKWGGNAVSSTRCFYEDNVQGNKSINLILKPFSLSNYEYDTL